MKSSPLGRIPRKPRNSAAPLPSWRNFATGCFELAQSAEYMQKHAEMPKILSFSPYASWKIHSNYETTILRGCRARGGDTLTVLCDGLFGECDMYGASQSSAGRPFDLCQRCQSGARGALDSTGLPYTWLSRYLRSEERQAVFEWAQGLRPVEFETASYAGIPLGWMVTTSVISYFRVPQLRQDDWHMVNVHRGFLHAGATVVVALGRLLDEWSPNALLLFNGRLSVLRIAMEMARKRNLRCLVHEASRYQAATLFAVEGESCISPVPFRRFWADWQSVPLTEAECASALHWFIMRRYRESVEGLRFTRPPGKQAHVLSSLSPSPGQKILALFTTSTDEVTGDPDLVGPFRSQEDWIEGVIAYASQRSDCLLVIRGHPCLAGGEGIGRAEKSLAWFRSLCRRAPANVRVILPNDPLSTYDLMDVAHAGLSYGSTAGLEMFVTGKPVGVVPGFAFYQDLTRMIRFDDPALLASHLDDLIATPPSIEFTRQALRCVYRRFFHMLLPFQLVQMTGPFTSKLAYKDEKALQPGADEGLDRTCSFLLEGKSLWNSPLKEDQGRTNHFEDELIRGLLEDPGWIKHARLTRKGGRVAVRKVMNTIRKWTSLGLRAINGEKSS